MRSQVPTLKETAASLFCVHCFLYLVSSSVNVSIFHSTCLDALCTELVASLLDSIPQCLGVQMEDLKPSG